MIVNIFDLNLISLSLCKILKMKIFHLFLLLVIVGSSTLYAQGGEVMLGIKRGNNAILGSFTAASVEAKYEHKDHFAIVGGAQSNTVGRVSAAVRPQYFHDFYFGRLYGEVMFEYSHQSRTDNYVIGCGTTLDARNLWVTIGYYHRTLTFDKDRICEPFNIYYELGVRCLPKLEQWDLNILFTNSKMFELERHYQPSFVIEGLWYPIEKLGIQAGVTYKPAGMFHISSDYYQFYANVGLCFKW